MGYRDSIGQGSEVSPLHGRDKCQAPGTILGCAGLDGQTGREAREVSSASLCISACKVGGPVKSGAVLERAGNEAVL